MTGFGDFAYAIEFREAIQRLITSEIHKHRPDYEYAIVNTVDLVNRVAQVLLSGELNPVTVKLGAISPLDAGQVVRIGGRRGDRHIADVLSGPINVRDIESGRGLIGEVKIESNSAAVSSETVVTGLTLSVPVGTARKLKIEFTGRVNTTVPNDLARLRIRNGLTTGNNQLAEGRRLISQAGGTGQETITFYAKGVFTGNQDFCITLERAAGTGSELIAAESTSPAILSVYDEGT